MFTVNVSAASVTVGADAVSVVMRGAAEFEVTAIVMDVACVTASLVCGYS